MRRSWPGLRAEGRIKLSQVPREITAMAEAYVLAHREIIVEARARVEQWRACVDVAAPKALASVVQGVLARLTALPSSLSLSSTAPAGSCRTVARWPSARNVSSRI